MNNNRTRHASQRCAPRRVVCFLRETKNSGKRKQSTKTVYREICASFFA